MRIATHVSFVVMVAILIVCAHEASRIHTPLTVQTALTQARAWGFDTTTLSNAERTDEAADEGVVDLYGNEITDAVARYKLDAEGSLYELHSPRTELPRLGSPKS